MFFFTLRRSGMNAGTVKFEPGRLNFVLLLLKSCQRKYPCRVKGISDFLFMHESPRSDTNHPALFWKK